MLVRMASRLQTWRWLMSLGKNCSSISSQLGPLVRHRQAVQVQRLRTGTLPRQPSQTQEPAVMREVQRP